MHFSELWIENSILFTVKNMEKDMLLGQKDGKSVFENSGNPENNMFFCLKSFYVQKSHIHANMIKLILVSSQHFEFLKPNQEFIKIKTFL